MGEFAVLEALDAGRVDAFVAQHALEQQPRAGAALAVDEAHVAAQQVGQAVDLARIARRDHQPLAALGEQDHALLAGVQPAGVGVEHFALVAAQRHVEAGQFALAVAQRGQRFLGADVFALERDVGALQRVDQLLDRKAVAGVDAQGAGRRAGDAAQLGLQLRRQRVEHGRQAGVDATLGPYQAFTQRAQPRALAARHRQQRGAEQRVALAHHVPAVPVRQPELRARRRQAAVLVHLQQQREQPGRQRAAVGAQHPLRLDRDRLHEACSLYAVNRILTGD
ncbi:hypothetical protein GALL_392800 [mine drainage metagenome]|uniref:Uncharacterized protein n=1 Tax=mine drainage metagenome TaxID=410659 RepID=A0A1J5QGA1_9ZZZZ